MIDTALWVLLGAFIGWHYPQPFWARFIQEKIMKMIRGDKAE